MIKILNRLRKTVIFGILITITFGIQTKANSVPLPNLPLPTNAIKLQLARSLVGADKVFDAGYQGAGVTVAIIDSGVRADTQQFVGRIATEVCIQTTPGSFCPDKAKLIEGPGVSDPEIVNGIPACR